MKKNDKSAIVNMIFIAMMAAIMAVCAWITIPAAVPFTLQTFAVFLAICVLGGKNGTIAVFVYILLGAVGLPVFSGFKGGVGVLLGNTGGYIIGFLFSALVMWLLEGIFGRKFS
ncbi:MAG: biotin transporter BioY, partial [Lachnospiraceae bacterium]|nr:biotin transporter BioY [Lachnospiraceae bacterium]